MLGGRAGSRQSRYTQAASTYVFGSHDLCLYLHQASSCTWGYSGAGGMDVLMCPKEMARPPQARTAGLREMDDGQSAPQLPAASQSSQQQSSQDLEARSDRVALKIARTSPQLLPVALYIATNLTHLCLAGRG